MKRYFDYLEDKQIQKIIIDNGIKFLKKGDYEINKNFVSRNMQSLGETFDKMKHFQNVEYETSSIFFEDDCIHIFFYIGYSLDYHCRMFTCNKEDCIELHSMLKEIFTNKEVEK